MLSPRAVLDSSSFPLVVLTECGALPDLDRVRVLEGLLEVARRGERHGLVFDLRTASVMPPTQREYVVELFRDHADILGETWAGLALLVCEPVIQNMGAALFWMKVSPAHARVFADLEAASVWAGACASLSLSGSIPVEVGKSRARKVR